MKAEPNAKMTNNTPMKAFCLTDNKSAMMLPINVPKAIPKCNGSLVKVCWKSGCPGAALLKWPWTGGGIAQLSTPQMTKTSQKNTNDTNGITKRQTPNKAITVNNVRLTPNLSADTPPRPPPVTAATPYTK